MNSCPPAAIAARVPARPAGLRLPSRLHLPLTASITLSFLAGSSAPTPLYPIYQAMWHFSSVTLTLVFASYVLVLLAALLVFGRLSDHVGRKPVIVFATLMQVVAMALFATADGVVALFAGRVVQGVATGAALGAIGAAMLEIDAARGTIANSVAPPLGTALGGFISGILVHFLPAPTLLVYVVLSALYLLQAAAILAMPEPGRARPGAWQSLRPQLAVPANVRPALRAALPVLVAGWTMAGFYASLGPALVHRVFGYDASLGGGIALFLLAGSAGAAVMLLRGLAPERLLRLGAHSLAAGSAIVLAALVEHSLAAFVLGAIVAGAGFGTGFQGGVRTVVVAATPAQRAAVLSVVFVAAYLAMGLPAVAAGWLTARTGNLSGVADGLGAAVIVLALLASRAARTTATPSPVRQE
jgi:MFS family permease